MSSESGEIYSVWKSKILSNWVHYALLLLGSLVPMVPLLTSGTWMASHEDERYIVLLDCFRTAFQHGILYPRWLPDLFGGYGCPTFCFYQPGFFFIALPFSFLPGYPLYTMYLALFFLFAAGTIGTYKLCSELADRGIGLFCALLFLFTPYLYVNFYVRGDLSELTAMLFCPWPIYFLLRLRRVTEERRLAVWTMLGLALSLATVVVSHLAPAFFLFPILCLIALYLGWKTPQRGSFFMRTMLSIALALALSSPYWWTVFQMKGHVNLERATEGYNQAKWHTVHLSQFFSRTWGFGGSFDSLGTLGSGDGMSFQLGAIHFALATIGAFFARNIGIYRLLYGLYIVLILLMTPFAGRVWGQVELLRLVQFPWRLLAITATLQIACIAGLKKLTDFSLVKIGWPVLLSLLLGAIVLWHGNQFSIEHPLNAKEKLQLWKMEILLTKFYTFSGAGEFVPKTVEHRGALIPRRAVIADRKTYLPRKTPVPILRLMGFGHLEALEESSPYRMRYRIENSEPVNLLIEQLYFPGWKVLVDGREIPRQKLEQKLTIDGRMMVHISSPGSHTFEAFYEGPPGWKVRDLIIGFVVLVFGWFCLKQYCGHF